MLEMGRSCRTHTNHMSPDTVTCLGSLNGDPYKVGVPTV